jgi:hypothetical protein
VAPLLGGPDPAHQRPEHGLRGNYDADDFDRAVAVVGAEPSPQRLVEQLGIDWEYLTRLALDAAATVLAAEVVGDGGAVAYGREAFTGAFLIGVHLPPKPPLRSPARLAAAVDVVQERGRHAVIADHCDLASVARLETVYADALVQSMPLGEAERDALRLPLTRIFEAGLAVGLELGSGGFGEDNPVET